MGVRKRALRRFEGMEPVARTVVAVAREEQITLLAASLAYYLFLALVPLVLFAVIALSLFGNGLLSQASTAASGTVLPSGTSVPRQLLTQTSGRVRAAALGAVILAWSGLRMFGALDGAFAAVYDERGTVSLTGKVRDATLVLVTVTAAAAALAGISLAFAVVVENGSVLRLLSPLLLFATLTVAFLPMFYVLPEVDGVSIREILPGTLFAALAWTVSGVVVRLYATASSSVALYGAVGGLLLVLTWLYIGGLALLVGAALNASLVGRVDPDTEWLPAR
ncbi:YihY/virulence factor BrkB family protein [Halococcus sp. PRR34]|uniref:YihY/virulence factor BrkB family protein n=1 Tax=Halococcus sp. PRR34 TaxID=3020830 RepID=UPI00235FD861|nr:YihY/virulence factor BrkB family protein [Halococcus sp. PRR34]